MSTDDDKTRLRSDEELEAQARGLVDVVDALAALGVPHYLSGGTLLGAARDGDFIRWDWDVEVSVPTESVLGRLDEVVRGLTGAGFVVRTIDEGVENLKVVVVRDGAVYEIQGYRLEGEWRTRSAYRTRARFFDEATTVTLRGRTYACMGPLDDYLTDRYGDWRTPLRTADKSAYLAPGYFREPAWRRRVRVLAQALARRARPRDPSGGPS